MNTKEELKAAQEAVEAFSEESVELTEEELGQVFGGHGKMKYINCPGCRAKVENTPGLHKCPYCGHNIFARKHYSA